MKENPMIAKARALLPLFDAICTISEAGNDISGIVCDIKNIDSNAIAPLRTNPIYTCESIREKNPLFVLEELKHIVHTSKLLIPEISELADKLIENIGIVQREFKKLDDYGWPYSDLKDILKQDFNKLCNSLECFCACDPDAWMNQIWYEFNGCGEHISQFITLRDDEDDYKYNRHLVDIFKAAIASTTPEHIQE
jgi:hypothetical protein